MEFDADGDLLPEVVSPQEETLQRRLHDMARCVTVPGAGMDW